MNLWACEDCGVRFIPTAQMVEDEHGECPNCGSVALYETAEAAPGGE